MFQGDLVQQGITAKVTGHTGEKGCLRCFMLGTNTLQDGTDLHTQRWLGCRHPAQAEVMMMPPEGQQFAVLETRLDLQFAIQNEDIVTFNRELAESIAISDEQHGIRARTACMAIESALEQHPIPETPPAGSTQQQRDTHRAGAFSSSSFFSASLNLLGGRLQ
jgi:hypothetical protein